MGRVVLLCFSCDGIWFAVYVVGVGVWGEGIFVSVSRYMLGLVPDFLMSGVLPE